MLKLFKSLTYTAIASLSIGISFNACAEPYSDTPMEANEEVSGINIEKAEQLLATHHPQQALQLLNTPLPENAPKELLARIYLVRAKSHAQLGNELKSIQERIELDNYLTSPNDLQQNHNAIWTSINNLSSATLRAPLNQNGNTIYNGWLALGAITRQYNNHPDMLIQAVNGWRNQFPDHPANTILPQNLNTAIDTPTHPKQIALLIPMEGNHKEAGKAIRDGFFGAYYSANQNGEKPTIKIYDTAQRNAADLYQQAVSEGADIVVGPLLKENVKELANLSESSFTAPVIALNQIDNNNQNFQLPNKLFQFALSPESEASILATKVIQDGKRNILLIVPDSDWGKRLANRFNQKMTELHGLVVETAYVNPRSDQNSAVSKLFKIDNSSARAKNIHRIIGEKVESQPRRREDMDAIVLATPPQQARQLKPLFDFYFAQHMPLYSTSNVYSGHPNAKRDIDLNGIIFCDIPWILAPDQTQYFSRYSELHKPQQNEQYHRLYAMGMDAFELTYQLKRLMVFPKLGYRGATGKLSLSTNNQIERELVWAQFKGGVPQRLK